MKPDIRIGWSVILFLVSGFHHGRNGQKWTPGLLQKLASRNCGSKLRLVAS